MSNLLEAAIAYSQAGLSIIPVTQNKRSIGKWKLYQHKQMDIDQLILAFDNPLAKGIAVICGKVSGNLEVIDVDSKNDLHGQMFHHLLSSINMHAEMLLSRLVIAQTKNLGFRLFYKCQNIGGNTILASRSTTDDEKKLNPGQKAKVLIETRSNGGYVIVPPTSGYHFIQRDFFSIPDINTEERQLLLNLSIQYNTFTQPISTPSFRKTDNDGIYSPFDDYNMRGDIIGLLERHGWKVIYKTAEQTFFRRPGQTDHDTSGDYNHVLGYFGVFSASTEFIPYKGYRPAAVYAMLECGGDFTTAAKKLLQEGYGIAYKDRRRP